MDHPNFIKYTFHHDTSELRKYITENPDLPILVMAGEDANIGDAYWMVASVTCCTIGEYLSVIGPNEEKVYIDRDELEEDIADYATGDKDVPSEDFIRNRMQ